MNTTTVCTQADECYVEPTTNGEGDECRGFRGSSLKVSQGLTNTSFAWLISVLGQERNNIKTSISKHSDYWALTPKVFGKLPKNTISRNHKTTNKRLPSCAKELVQNVS